ncbi:putative f-box domain protein [Erysiphe neolycopersici]|uniref:Putative f-box domain protein n=1 Tax=Erysiphe neolycopersici TaxID=212602 RepID=A0A420HAH8_9PEZI|nr:putative f-box domain protein [Erysiphe neolycopersici]
MRGNNFFDKLPHELCLDIVDNLYLDDLLRLRLVCRSWHQVFCNTDICTHAIKKYFSLPINHYINISRRKNSSNLEEDREKGDWLRKFMINRIRREHGISSKSFELNYDLDPYGFDLCYSNARVAQKNKDGFLIENLITRQRYNFASPPNAGICRKWQLSDQYLLVLYSHQLYWMKKFITKTHSISCSSSERSDLELVAWNLVSRRKQSIRVKTGVCSISAYRNWVGIVNISANETNYLFESSIWDVGGTPTRLQDIKPDIVPSVKGIKTVDLFFHKLDKDVVFLVYHTMLNSSLDSTRYGTKITVQCIEAGILTQTQHEVIYTLAEPDEFRSVLITNDNIIGFELLDCSDDFPHLNPYKHLTYNINKRQFNYFEVCLHLISWEGLFWGNILIWRDQIYIPVLNGFKGELQIVTISKSLTDAWNIFPESTYSPNRWSIQSSILCGETRQNSADYDFDKYVSFLNPPSRIWGDDSFLIFKCEKGLMVWQFNDLGLESEF